MVSINGIPTRTPLTPSLYRLAAISGLPVSWAFPLTGHLVFNANVIQCKHESGNCQAWSANNPCVSFLLQKIGVTGYNHVMKKRGRPPTGVETALIRVKKDLARKLRFITLARKTTSAEYLDPKIRPVIERDHSQVIKEEGGA